MICPSNINLLAVLRIDLIVAFGTLFQPSAVVGDIARASLLKVFKLISLKKAIFLNTVDKLIGISSIIIFPAVYLFFPSEALALLELLRQALDSFDLNLLIIGLLVMGFILVCVGYFAYREVLMILLKVFAFCSDGFREIGLNRILISFWLGIAFHFVSGAYIAVIIYNLDGGSFVWWLVVSVFGLGFAGAFLPSAAGIGGREVGIGSVLIFGNVDESIVLASVFGFFVSNLVAGCFGVIIHAPSLIREVRK